MRENQNKTVAGYRTDSLRVSADTDTNADTPSIGRYRYRYPGIGRTLKIIHVFHVQNYWKCPHFLVEKVLKLMLKELLLVLNGLLSFHNKYPCNS